MADAYDALILSGQPAGYWRLVEPAGATSARDASGGGRHAQGSGAYAAGDPGPFGWSVESSPPRAARFDAGGWLRAAAPLNTVPLTIEAWARPRLPHGSPSGTVFALCSSTSQAHWYRIVASGAPWFIDVNGPEDGSRYYAMTGPWYTPGAWHHLAVSFDLATGIRLHVDGVHTDTRTLPEAPASSFVDRFAVGRLDRPSPAEPFDGRVARVAVYPRVLTAAEVSARWTLGSQGPGLLKGAALLGGAA